MKEQIDLPYGLTLRHYQRKAWNAFFINNVKHHLLIWHRRAGKTKFAINVIAAASQMRVGSYYYLFPVLVQARRTVWEGRGDDGMRFIDHFPRSMIKKINNTDMRIEFKNGSIFRLIGTDKENFQKVRGSNPMGVLYDEYAQQNPYARDTIIPVLAQNKGWEMIISTPYGMNHMFDLYEGVKNNEEWFVDKLTIDDTVNNVGEPIVDEQSIEEFKKSGWSSNQIQQEFYCSFTAAIRGAYFADELDVAEQEDRIRNFPIDPSLPVYTYWDLGHHDSTAIWLVQKLHEEIRCIAYYENNLQPLSHYINWLYDFRDQHRVVYAMHYGPHDVTSKHFSTGKSTMDIAWELGFQFERVPRCSDKRAEIDNARFILSRCWFHEENCRRGLRCLREYHMPYNASMQTYSDHPVHDWASHGADAFLTLCQTIDHKYNPHFSISSNRLLQGMV